MKVYLDDDMDSNVLIGLLEKAGHKVVSPRAAGTRGQTDENHLRYAAEQGFVLLTANAVDFIELHQQWMSRRETHHGILIVYRENNPVQDMTLQEIAQAITRVERSGLGLENSYQNLNFWRGGGQA
ncbi:hypothetical protein EPO44_11965 [bacterium]|nr:MAG: hypothetical protein EPO44_11965 [bacterium]